jgi:predicted CXXCH cytochrome family protein
MADWMTASANSPHPPAADRCTSCHNPHNSEFPKLLDAQPFRLCTGCHDDIGTLALDSAVKHGALESERSCLNCHDPHASPVEYLLQGLPFDLCVDCHGQDGILDGAGVELTNIGALVAGSHMRHAPVEEKDCTACHEPHGGEGFRLLVDEYPAKFYASYSEENYGLCFTCHDAESFEQSRTRNLTGFRNGDRNLHFVHVNKEKRGRTCRACHEVHAAPQDHLLRNGVPYGKRGWILKLNYTQEENGGSCAKTCHVKRTYDRTARDGQ